MDKSTFLREYVISAVAGSAVGRGSLKPHEIVQDALDTWNAISDATAEPEGSKTKSPKKGE
jgi:hypothetical protein